MTTQASQLSEQDARTASAQAQHRIRELEAQMIAERAKFDAMRARVVIFAGQLSAWGHQETAVELMKEILQGPVTTDHQYATLRANFLSWRAAALALVMEWRKERADNDRLRAENVALANDLGTAEHQRDQADNYASEMEWGRRRLEEELEETRAIAERRAADIRALSSECARLLVEMAQQAEQARATSAELKRCAAAHQKALEQTEHYGVALTQLAIAGNPIANDALGCAPHQDRIVVLFRELNELRTLARAVCDGAEISEPLEAAIVSTASLSALRAALGGGG